MTIKNRDEIVSELAEKLMQFDCMLNHYQTDVYAYIAEDGTVTLADFDNVGGNSWLNDDHYIMYTDREHYSSARELLIEYGVIGMDDERTDDEYDAMYADYVSECADSSDVYDNTAEAIVKRFEDEMRRRDEWLRTNELY